MKQEIMQEAKTCASGHSFISRGCFPAARHAHRFPWAHLGTQNGSHVVAPICCLLLAVHLQPSGWEAAYLMPLGVCVQNMVGPESPVKAVQVHFFTTEDFVCDVKQYLHAAMWSSKGPSDCSVNCVEFVFCSTRAPAEATRSARRTNRRAAMLMI